MKIKSIISIILLAAVCVNAQIRNARRPVSSAPPATSTATTQLPIKRVILYSNGVAYIERRGFISGNAEINLSFKQSQVDDVLKSMVVLDLGQGRIGAVSYNSALPASARTAEIPFSVNAETGGNGVSGILGQLQGAKVLVTSAKGAATGAILTVEKRAVIIEPSKPSVQKTFLTIASEAGEIQSFDLDEVRSVKLLDEGTRHDVNEFANAAAAARRRDAKTITVTSDGTGQREMVVSYTVAAPIWKTTYRVVLDEKGNPFFQGWAIVDNVSDEDWRDVKLSLISGSPISFIQPIQQPFYRYRPVVPMPNDLQLEPQVYEQGGGSGSGNGSGDGDKNELGTSISSKQVSQLPANGISINGTRSSSNRIRIDGQEVANFSTADLSSNNSSLSNTSISNAIISEGSGVETAAAGSEIGDLFEYRIEQPMTVLRDRSALIPIIQTKLEGERAAIYNEATRRDRPMGGMLLKNLTPLTFEGGSLTVIDRDAYAGEALMERLKPKEQRLISFALDLGTHVRVRNDQIDEPAKTVKVINGVLQVQYFRVSKKRYQITNQTDKPKVLYIEHPVRDGWKLSDDTPKPDYTTQRYHRFRVELKPFDDAEISVGERRSLFEQFELENVGSTDVELFVTRKYIDEPTRVRLMKLVELREKANGINAKIQALNNEVTAITNDQKRLRENIEALSKTAEAKSLIARYIQKANDQETRLEAIAKERDALSKQQSDIEEQLEVEIKNFSL